MATTKQKIERWLNHGKEIGATHVIVVCDTFDWSDGPVYVMPGENAREEADRQHRKSMQKVMEVYSLSKDIGEQLAQSRVFNYD